LPPLDRVAGLEVALRHGSIVATPSGNLPCAESAAMVFTSDIFLFYFLPLTLLGYYLLPVRRRNTFLALASYVFYGWWNPWFVLLMWASTIVDFACGLAITAPQASPRQRKQALVASVVVYLSLLGFFKYAGFFTANLNSFLGIAGFGATDLPILDVVLPVGISFYTFQSMSYSIDLYRGRASRARSFGDFAAYVALFPQLVAGPIVRYHDLAEQLRKRSHTLDKMARGLAYFTLGFAKKVLLANNVGEIADLVFATERPAWHLAWFGIIAYAFQIYFDFSGYSDMAIGLGWMFGFRIPQNFNSPYHADSITDFWKRWHMSLSTWLRDYLYVPLGGNRKGRVRTYVNLALTMLLGGLWHGAQWRFIVWGAFHGLLLAAERATSSRSLFPRAPRQVRILLTFVLVLVAWVFFRAASLGDALLYLGSMFGLLQSVPESALLAGMVYRSFPLTIMAVAALIVVQRRRTQDWVDDEAGSLRYSPLAATAVVLVFLLSIAELSAQSNNPFLYFQF